MAYGSPKVGVNDMVLPMAHLMDFSSLVLEVARNSNFKGKAIRLDGAIRMAPR